jgi:hypothetical protein
MIEDPIVEDVRRHRQAHAAQNGYDLARIVQALRRRERESDRLLLNPGPNIRDRERPDGERPSSSAPVVKRKNKLDNGN